MTKACNPQIAIKNLYYHGYMHRDDALLVEQELYILFCPLILFSYFTSMLDSAWCLVSLWFGVC